MREDEAQFVLTVESEIHDSYLTECHTNPSEAGELRATSQCGPSGFPLTSPPAVRWGGSFGE